MEEEPWFTGPQYRIIATFRNTRKHTGDGVEIPATHGASSTKGTNRSVGFIGPWEHRRPFRFVTRNSRQLRFRTLFARFTVADQIAQCKENYNYEHKLF